MFPYVCAAMIPVFCDPATISKLLRIAIETTQSNKLISKPAVIGEKSDIEPSIDTRPKLPIPSVEEEPKSKSSVEEEPKSKPGVDVEPKRKPIFDEDPKYKLITEYEPPTRTKQNIIAACICAYTVLQLFLPYSHFITQVGFMARKHDNYF